MLWRAVRVCLHMPLDFFWELVYYGVMKGGDDMPRLLKVREVAEILGISVRSVRRHAANGVIPAPVFVRKSVRWRSSDLERYMQSL